jgi:hypothetical protein
MTPTYLERLPDHVLKYMLFPYLYYGEREAVNTLLPKSYRVSTKLKSRILIRYDIMLACIPIKEKLALITPSLTGKAREDMIYTIMSDILPKHLIIARYNAHFRQSIYERINYFLDDNNPEYATCSPNFKDTIAKACNSLKKLLASTFAYKYELSSMDTKSSPVDIVSQG